MYTPPFSFLTLIGSLAMLGVASPAPAATEDIGFVAEHLPEVAMDNRYAGLPLWRSGLGFDLGYTTLSSGTLTLRGPMLQVAESVAIRGMQLRGFAFFDSFALRSGLEHRPLAAPFASIPIALPAAAEFVGLEGSMRHLGAGLALGDHVDHSWVGPFDWSVGLLWQRVQLLDYRLDYRLLDGIDAGATGVVDFSATYVHVTPFAGVARAWEFGHWQVAPHVQLALPLPRRPFAGRIAGTGFDATDDAAIAGTGKHFGDPSVTLGLDLTYLPWNLTLDAGSFITQALNEPLIHEGIDRNWALRIYLTR